MANLMGLPVGTKVIIYYSAYGSTRGRKAVVESVTKGGNYKLSGSDSVWTPGGRRRGSDIYGRTSILICSIRKYGINW